MILFSNKLNTSDSTLLFFRKQKDQNYIYIYMVLVNGVSAANGTNVVNIRNAVNVANVVNAQRGVIDALVNIVFDCGNAVT